MPYLVEPVVAVGSMSSLAQPVITVDDELVLRPFGNHDAEAVCEAFSDADIVRWHCFRVDTVEQACEWIDRNHAQWAAEKSAVWAVVDRSDSVLGRCALHVDLRAGTGEIAYWVLASARRRAVASRAARAVTHWGHRELGLERILLAHSTRNPASCAVADRLGYRAEGIARNEQRHTDGWHDMHHHAHLADD